MKYNDFLSCAEIILHSYILKNILEKDKLMKVLGLLIYNRHESTVYLMSTVCSITLLKWVDIQHLKYLPVVISLIRHVRHQ